MDLGTVMARLTGARGMVAVDHAAKTLKSNREALKAYRASLLTNQDGQSSAELPGGEDMMVLGDVHQTITHEAPKVVEKAQNVARGIGWLAKLAIGAGLIGTGAGGAIGIPMVWDAIVNRPTTVINQGADDSDTATDIGFWDKEQ